jgi:hypothetical protein
MSWPRQAGAGSCERPPTGDVGLSLTGPEKDKRRLPTDIITRDCPVRARHQRRRRRRKNSKVRYGIDRKQFFRAMAAAYREGGDGSCRPQAGGLRGGETVMRFSTTGALPLLLTASLAAAVCGAAGPAPQDDSAAGGLVVHEWGTFSTFSGSDGRNLKFYPYDNDLPGFVHGYQGRDSKAGPQGGTISLETPVLYFYADRPLTASARVDFPRGTLTEWFPHAARTDHRLVWDGISVLPKQDVRLLSEKEESRYYAARDTDAAPLRVSFQGEGGRAVTEPEKFLFYRGVGTFAMPLTVKAMGEDRFGLRWEGQKAPGAMVLVRVQGGKVRFQPFRLETEGKDAVTGEVRLPDKDSTPEKLGDLLVARLTEKGLYGKEARAMVKTWESAWFGEEGTRVLYLLPGRLTDELLPLAVEPKPKELVRVLVGRHDVLTPGREKQIDSLVAKISRPAVGQEEGQEAARRELSKLGRYQGAAQQEAEARLRRRQ